jgi:gliding motility-associated-like protein
MIQIAKKKYPFEWMSSFLNLSVFRNTLVFVFSFHITSSYAQLDVKHYIPPMHARVSPGTHYLVLGTPVSSTFNVTVRDGAGNLLTTIPISSAASSTTIIGSDYTSPLMVAYNSLNTVLSSGKGLILTASEPFYANIRVKVTNQAGSLTSKGEKASKGKDFRVGHMFNNAGASSDKSNFFSFMATENNTTVVVSDIRGGVVLEGKAPGITSFIVQLNQGQSYVLTNYLDNAIATNNSNGLNGTHITANKDIVVNCGTWLGGNALNGTSATGSFENGKDIGIDQIVPVEQIGTEYVLIKGFGVDNERTVVVASADNTQLFINGNTTPLATLNAGDYHVIYGTSFSTNNNLYLKSTEPVFVTQTINGSDGYTYDNEHCAGMNFIPPLTCTGEKKVNIPNVQFIGTAYIQIIADAGAVIQVNGNVIGGAQAVQGTGNYVTYSVSGYSGDVQIVSTLPVRVALINVSGNVGSAGYFSGFSKEISMHAKYENNGVETISEIVEGCGKATLIFERLSYYASSNATISLQVAGGSATEGLDFSSIPAQLTFPAGQTQVSLEIDAFADHLTEGAESVTISFNIDGSNCNGSELTFKILDIADLVIDMYDPSLECIGDSVMIFPVLSGGVKPYTYLWSTGDTTNYLWVKPNYTTTYAVTVVDFCTIDTAKADAIVTVPINNLSVFAGIDSTVLCPYTSLKFLAEVTGGQEDYTFAWMENGKQIWSFEELAISPANSSSYVVQVTDKCGLSSKDTVNVTVITPLMQLIVNNDKIICPYDEVELWGHVNGGLAPFNYYWDHSGETDTNVFVNPSVSTTYTVRVTDACATYEVVGYPFVKVVKPLADFEILSNTVMNNLPINFENLSVGGVLWDWDLGNGEFSNLYSPSTSYVTEGYYNVTLIVTDDKGCIDSITKQIYINPEFYFYAPNAFTPDGSQFNNTYKVSVIGSISFEFSIYNRWGELVFKSNDPEFEWDGTYNGQIIQDGVYVYKAAIESKDKEQHKFNGHINLLR